jgi:hypothetical protein
LKSEMSLSFGFDREGSVEHFPFRVSLSFT